MSNPCPVCLTAMRREREELLRVVGLGGHPAPGGLREPPAGAGLCAPHLHDVTPGHAGGPPDLLARRAAGQAAWLSRRAPRRPTRIGTHRGEPECTVCLVSERAARHELVRLGAVPRGLPPRPALRHPLCVHDVLRLRAVDRAASREASQLVIQRADILAQKALLAGLTEPAAIVYRQHVLTDCLAQLAVTREIYDLAVEAIALEKREYFGLFRDSPDTILHRWINLVANALAQSVDHIKSFFVMLATELGFYIGCLNRVTYRKLTR